MDRLDWATGPRIAGRWIRPVHLGVMLAAFTVLLDMNDGAGEPPVVAWLSYLVAALALVSMTLLAYGFATDRWHASITGLLMSAWLWGTLAAGYAFAGRGINSLMAVAWLIVSGGAYLLEGEDRRRSGSEPVTT